MESQIENTEIKTTLSVAVKVGLFIMGSTLTIMAAVYNYKNENSSNFRQVDSRMQSVENKMEVFQITQTNQFELLKNDVKRDSAGRSQQAIEMREMKDAIKSIQESLYRDNFRNKYVKN